MEVNKKLTTNGYGVKICICCASCLFKQIDKNLRICKKGEGLVPPSYSCNSWKMMDSLENAGKGDGKIKKKEYLRFALERLNKDEFDAITAAANKLPFKRTTIFEIREEFRKRFGSIYSIEK